MQNFVRVSSVLFVSFWLVGCLSQTELPDTKGSGLNDDASTQADTNTSTNNQINTPLGDDILIAPLEPTLRIQAAPGALEFAWQDRHNDTATAITEINLYQYDYRSELEVAVDATIDPNSSRYTHSITAHKLAWDSASYRIEICTQDNCLSSARMPINDLLSNAVVPITASDTKLSNSFGDQLALNAEGSVAIVTSPDNASALVFFHIADRWIQASTLVSDSFTTQANSVMRLDTSASGDTIVIATIASNSRPVAVVFDRVGENWIETSSIIPVATNNASQNWFADTLAIALSDDGDRLAIAALSPGQSASSAANTNNRVMIFDRSTLDWTNTTSLSVPAQHNRLPSFSTSASIDQVFILSALNRNLYLHEFAAGTNGWANAEPQFISAVTPTVDNIVVSSANGTELAIAGWEREIDSRFSAVAWRLRKTAGSWIANDSVKLPPVALTAATLRLAADATLASIAIGWQGTNSANLAFYADNQQRWQHLFSVPEAFNLNRDLPLAQSVAISADNSTALIGTRNTGNGGMVSAFR